MTPLSLMVHLAFDEPNDARLKVAGDLAEQFHSRVIGVAAGDILSTLYFGDGAYAADLAEQERTRINDRMVAVEREFRAALGERVKVLEWRSALTFPSSFILGQTRAADLIVSGSQAGGDARYPVARLDAGELVLRAGRPVLLVPPDASGLKLKNAMIAWKDTREARRAVSDALPLLRQANEVFIVQLLDPDEDQAAAKLAVDDLAEWLALHEIIALSKVSVATAVQNPLGVIATDIGADLIVAGAYGHSRLREWVWGGATRDLLTRTRCCALIAH